MQFHTDGSCPVNESHDNIEEEHYAGNVTLRSSTLTADEVRVIVTSYRAFTEHNPDLLDEVCAPD